MPEIRNYVEPTSRMDDFHNFTLAIYEMGDGYNQKNVDRSWPKNLHARTDILLHQVGQNWNIPPSQRHRGKKKIVWKNINCKFGVLNEIVTDNGPQFISFAF